MAEHAEEQKQEGPQSVAKLTTEIVVAYVSRNTIAPADLGDLIGAVAGALDALGRESTEPATAKPEPAVPVRRSIQDDHLVCLVCGKQQRPFSAISMSRTSSRRRRIASGSGSSPTTPWRHRATRGSVPRWPGASAWDVANQRRHEPGSPAAARDPAIGERPAHESPRREDC